jgi:hypothetical protein
LTKYALIAFLYFDKLTFEFDVGMFAFSVASGTLGFVEKTFVSLRYPESLIFVDPPPNVELN